MQQRADQTLTDLLRNGFVEANAIHPVTAFSLGGLMRCHTNFAESGSLAGCEHPFATIPARLSLDGPRMGRAC